MNEIAEIYSFVKYAHYGIIKLKRRFSSMREIFFIGSSKKDLNKLPLSVRDTFSYGLDKAATGGRLASSKVLKGFGGQSVIELLEDHKTDTYRAVYTVKFKKALYVLHVFKKKSKKGASTPKKDIDLIKKRLKDSGVHYKLNF